MNKWQYSAVHNYACKVIQTQTFWGKTTCRVWLPSSVIPLPHHIRALSRAISSDRIRYFLADEVGLGKTIEVGLLMILMQRLVVSGTAAISTTLERRVEVLEEKLSVILNREEREWCAQLERRAQVIPEMVPLILIRVEGGTNE